HYTQYLKDQEAKANPDKPQPKKKETALQKIEREHSAVLQENYRLERELKARQDGDTFDCKASSAKQIAESLRGNLQPYKGKVRELIKQLCEQEGYWPTKPPKPTKPTTVKESKQSKKTKRDKEALNAIAAGEMGDSCLMRLAAEEAAKRDRESKQSKKTR